MGGSLLSALAVALWAGWRPLSRQVWGERSVALAQHGPMAALDAVGPAVRFPVLYFGAIRLVRLCMFQKTGGRKKGSQLVLEPRLTGHSRLEARKS